MRYIAERWISEYGADTPSVIREWALQLETAPTAKEFLEQIAEVAQALLDEQAARGTAESPGSTSLLSSR
ncbi:MAG TPA: hypothetical protein VGB82_10000 [Alphaproteobacteria bacterium]